MTYDPPFFPTTAERDCVRELLAAGGYRDGEIRSRLDARGPLGLRALPRAVLEERVTGTGGALGTLLGLFLVCKNAPIDRVESELGANGTRALEASGLITIEGGAVRPTACLTVVGPLVFASDLPEQHRAAERDFVLGPFGVTQKLADFTIRDPVGSVLDLGCGSGALAAFAAAHAGRVVATDISERAVAFAEFNAELNGIEHMECRAGSLFEPVSGERFDLIVCNPPYVISPSDTFVYRDGGTEICRQIVKEAPAHLTEGGQLQMMVEWPQKTGTDWRNEVSSWLDGIACDAWLLRVYSYDADEYADVWLSQAYRDSSPPPQARREWLDHLDLLGVDSVGGGMLLLRREARRTQIRTLRDAPKLTPGPVGGSLARWTRAQTLLADVNEPRELLDVVMAPAPSLERYTAHVPSGNGWRPASGELRLREGLRFGAKVDPVAEEIVGLLDGRRTPNEALACFAERHSVSAAPFVEGLPNALARLLELGLLVPVQRSA